MNHNKSDMDLVLNALQFAAEKHRDQKRKDQRGTPYINHPIEVADILRNIGKVYDPVLLAGALLHDTLEDTATTSKELSDNFGENVSNLVQEVTDDKSLPKEVRKQMQIDKSPFCSDKAKQLKIADKISNVRDLIVSPPKGWSLDRKRKYIQWSEDVVSGIRGCNPYLEKLFYEIIEKGKEEYY